MITVDSGQQVCPHQLQFKTGDTFNGKDLYYLSLSGVFIVNFSGRESSRNNWYRDKVTMQIPVTVLNFPAVNEIHPYGDMGFYYVPSFILKHWTIYVNQNSFSNDQVAVNDGMQWILLVFKLVREELLKFLNLGLHRYSPRRLI